MFCKNLAFVFTVHRIVDAKNEVKLFVMLVVAFLAHRSEVTRSASCTSIIVPPAFATNALPSVTWKIRVGTWCFNRCVELVVGPNVYTSSRSVRVCVNDAVGVVVRFCRW